ncbi:bleomycin resistance protein [Sphingomonas swuensis]|uniref:Bleomycin resistance protein n=1 Tax=Sphingomonas swuensis TaxID=977800 RepID=A0ABP7SXG4_9SPHN
MSDWQTPNLPSRDFDVTEAFMARLGFTRGYRSDGWMILRRGTLQIEYFHHPDFDPENSGYGTCLRLDDLDAFYRVCLAAGITEKSVGAPRLHPPRQEPEVRRAALIDPDFSLFHLIQN